MKRISWLFAMFLFALSAHAQTATFTLNGAPIALPGNKATFVGSVSGMEMQITKNFSLREDNVIDSTTNMQGFFGGFDYTLPALSTKLNSASPTLNGYKFQFYFTASAGTDRISDPIAKTTAQHYAFLGGGGVRYDLTNSGRWSLGAEVRWAKLPGFANNTVIVSLGPALHF